MAEHIKIGDISPRIQYMGDGTQTQFTYPFPIFAAADMEVYLDQAKQSTGFTVNGAGQSAGGDVTFTTAPANNVLVTLRRRLAIQRTSDFQESGEFRSKVINDELDYLTAALQQVDDDVDRSLRLDATDTAALLTLPDKTTRANMFLGFDANGDPIATDAAGPPGPTGPGGDMSGSNNLSELTSAATARTNLGLGTAATKNTGTANGDVVELDATGLPAVDGSQLTGISSTDNVSRANIILNAFRIAVNGGLSVMDMVDGVVDEFEDETGVDLPTSTNETYDATNDLYTSLQTTKDGRFDEADASQVDIGDGVANRKHIGFQWVASTTGTISTCKIDLELVNANSDVFCQLYSENAGSPGSAIGSASDTVTLNSAPAEFTFTFATPPSVTNGTTYWMVLTDSSGSGNVRMEQAAHNASYKTGASDTITSITDGSNGTGTAELRLEIVINDVVNMTLVSNATTALAQPDEAFVVLWQEDVDAVTLNTDLKAYASRDGGTTFTQITLAEEAALSTGRILTGTVDISGQPAGTSMKYKIETLNTKEQRIHGVGLEWS